MGHNRKRMHHSPIGDKQPRAHANNFKVVPYISLLAIPAILAGRRCIQRNLELKWDSEGVRVTGRVRCSFRPDRNVLPCDFSGLFVGMRCPGIGVCVYTTSSDFAARKVRDEQGVITFEKRDSPHMDLPPKLHVNFLYPILNDLREP